MPQVYTDHTYFSDFPPASVVVESQLTFLITDPHCFPCVLQSMGNPSLLTFSPFCHPVHSWLLSGLTSDTVIDLKMGLGPFVVGNLSDFPLDAPAGAPDLRCLQNLRDLDCLD